MRELLLYDGMLVMAVVVDDTGRRHLALAAEDRPDRFTYLLAQLAADDVDDLRWDDSAVLRRLVLTAPRLARLTVHLGEGGCDGVDEVQIAAADLTEADLPMP